MGSLPPELITISLLVVLLLVLLWPFITAASKKIWNYGKGIVMDVISSYIYDLITSDTSVGSWT